MCTNTYHVSKVHVVHCNADPKTCDLLIPAVVKSETQSDPGGSDPAVAFPAGQSWGWKLLLLSQVLVSLILSED